MERITIGALFDRVAPNALDREAFVFVDAGVRWTYRDVRAHVQRLAKGLIGIGVDAGDHVALWATNRPEWPLLQLAVAKVGGVLVPLEPASSGDELAYALERSQATTLFVTARMGDADALAVVAAECPEVPGARPGRISSRRFPQLKRMALLDDHSAPGVFAWSEVLAAGAGITDHLLRRRQEGVAPADVLTVDYRPGMAAMPGGAQLAHYNVVNVAHYAGECMRLGGRDRVCVPASFATPAGNVLGTIATLARGGTVVVPAERFDAEQTLAAVAGERCTALHGEPWMFQAELAQRRFHAYDLSTLRTGVIVTAACSPQVVRQVATRMHAREITVAYGTPETAGVITQTRTEDPLELHATSVGRALPHVEVRIVAPDGEHEVARGEEGELWCRGYPVMRGFRDRTAASAAVLDRDGWLHTGDLAVIDEHGYCRITGHVTDVVRHGGERIDVRPVEALLRSHPAVEDAAVFALPDPLGDELAAWIRLRRGAAADGQGIREFCRQRTSYGRTPRHVRVVAAYPTTPDGRVRKLKLRELALAELRGQSI